MGHPFNPTTKIKFALPNTATVQLVVYDIMGRRIKTLADHKFVSGKHEVTWKGRNQADEPVAAGMYIYRLTAQRTNGEAEVVLTKKMVLVK